MKNSIKSLAAIIALSIGLNNVNALAEQSQDNSNKAGIEYDQKPLSLEEIMKGIEKFHESLEGSWKDRFLPEKHTKHVKLNIKQIGKVNPKAIKIINAYLEHVPDAFQKLLNDNGHSFVIYDGKLTKLPQLKYLDEKKVPFINANWNEISGITTYDGSYINPNHIKQRGLKNIPLHETGHAIDITLGKLWNIPRGLLSNSKKYKEVFEKCRKSKVAKGKRQKLLRSELFAEGFALHYDGWGSRNAQKEECQKHYNFFHQLEQKVVFGKQGIIY